MRKIIEKQLKFGQVDISSIELDLRSRDEIPQLLAGLKAIYTNRETRNKVFAILDDIIPENTDTGNGRPGMDLWSILVLGTLRLNCNWDYDKVLEIANNHKTARDFLGHTIYEFDQRYALQTLKDNVSLLTPQHLDQINQVVVKAGHKLLGYDGQSLKGRCDSFVLETNVHYPTDINLLWDAIRKIITLTAAEFGTQGIVPNGARVDMFCVKSRNCLPGHADSNGPIQNKKSVRLKKNNKLFRLTSNMLIWLDFILNAPGLISIF